MEKEGLIKIIKSDYWIILLLLFALLACAYTILSVGNYQQAINDNWEKQWQQSGCYKSYDIPNIKYKYIGGYEDYEINDTYKNT